MASKKKSSGPARVPIGLVLGGLHLAYDLVSEARCPKCRSQVVLYFCTGCKTLVWGRAEDQPRRRQ